MGAAAVLATTLLLGRGDGVGVSDAFRAGLFASWTAAGLVLFTDAARRRLGALVLTGSATAAGALFAGAGAWADLLRPLCLAAVPVVALHFLLGLPNGVLGTRGRRVAVLAGYIMAGVVGLVMWTLGPGLPRWLLLLEAGSVVLGVPAANRRYLSTAGLDRQRLQWIGCAVVGSSEALLVLVALRLLLGWPHQAMAVLAAAVTVLVPLALLAGASPRLVTRVDRLLVHGVSLAGLTGLIVTVYLVIVLGLGRLPNEDERRLLALSMAAAAVIAFLYLPVRERLADAANRIVYGERHAPDEVLRTFGKRLSRAIPMDELLLQLAESLRRTMDLRSAEVWTGSGGVLERAASVPERGPASVTLAPAELPVVIHAGASGPAWLAIWLPALLAGREDALLRAVPITHSGQLLGLIMVERATGGDAFTEEEERVLGELARQTGLALHNVRLDSALQASLDEVRRQAAELQASRGRIVAAADAERRKIERNLHDGAQQQLVALAVNLRLARDLLAEDPEAASTLLGEMTGSIKDAVTELRNLAHGIYPPLLVDRGLPEALQAAAGRSALRVDVNAELTDRCPAEVEAAVYFCCLEALQNAAKYAVGSRVALRLWEEASYLRFEVVDDGPGFDPAMAGSGHGFVNMTDRVGAVGGTIRWDSAPGQGTKISGAVPRHAAS